MLIHVRKIFNCKVQAWEQKLIKNEEELLNIAKKPERREQSEVRTDGWLGERCCKLCCCCCCLCSFFCWRCSWCFCCVRMRWRFVCLFLLWVGSFQYFFIKTSFFRQHFLNIIGYNSVSRFSVSGWDTIVVVFTHSLLGFFFLFFQTTSVSMSHIFS